MTAAATGMLEGVEGRHAETRDLGSLPRLVLWAQLGAAGSEATPPNAHSSPNPHCPLPSPLAAALLPPARLF